MSLPKLHRKVAEGIGAVLILTLGALVVLLAGLNHTAASGETATPATAQPGVERAAAPTVGITQIRLFENHVVVRAVCPVDPPQTLFITGMPEGGGNGLLGSMPVTCTGQRQTFDLPLQVNLARGSVVRDVFVTVSGDGGEVSGHADSLRVRPGKIGTARLIDGRLVRDGSEALVRAEVQCPKGGTWSVAGTFVFAELGRDDPLASASGSGTCTGKAEVVRIRLVAFYNPPIPANCSAEFGVTFTYSTGGATNLERGGAGPATSGPVCIR